MRIKTVALCTMLLPVSTFVNAQVCDVQLHQDIKVTPTYIQVFDGEQSLYKIDNDSVLWIDSQNIHLNSEQKAALNEYRALIQALAPKVASLISEGVTVAKNALEPLINELFGNDVYFKNKIEAIIDKMERRVAPVLDATHDEYYLAKDYVNQNTDHLSAELKQEITNLMSDSSSHVLTFIGALLLKGEGGLQSLHHQIEMLGKSLDVKGKALEQEASEMCDKMKMLDELETIMHKKIPSLSKFDLLSAKQAMTETI